MPVLKPANLECNLKEGLPSPGRIALTNRARGDDSTIEVGVVRVESRHVIGTGVHSIATADSHPVENIVEFNS